MRRIVAQLFLFSASVLPLPALAQSGVVDNVLLRWVEQHDTCDQNTTGDGATPRDLRAMVYVAMFEAVNAVAGTYQPFAAKIMAAPGSSSEAAAAQAAHGVIANYCPKQRTAADAVLASSLALVRESAARAGGVAVGRKAAAAIIAVRANAKTTGLDGVYPAAAVGVYVPTATQIGDAWSRSAPWVLRTNSELRSPAPPLLSSEIWSRDYEEVRRMGAKSGSSRTEPQSDIAQFWGTRSVRIVLRQLVGLPGRSLVDDARFLALAEMAWADAYVSLFDAKYAWNFWRPVTAIRGGAIDGNDRTVPDAEWAPFLETPMHPEYPCGHCVSSSAVGTVIRAEFGDRMPTIVLDLPGALLRRYPTAASYMDEVSESRLLAGAHYRFSMDAGKAMGVLIGELAVERHFRPVGR